MKKNTVEIYESCIINGNRNNKKMRTSGTKELTTFKKYHFIAEPNENLHYDGVALLARDRAERVIFEKVFNNIPRNIKKGLKLSGVFEDRVYTNSIFNKCSCGCKHPLYHFEEDGLYVVGIEGFATAKLFKRLNLVKLKLQQKEKETV